MDLAYYATLGIVLINVPTDFFEITVGSIFSYSTISPMNKDSLKNRSSHHQISAYCAK